MCLSGNDEWKFLENLIYFLADNTGQLVSVNSIAKDLKSQGSKVTNDIVSKYIKSTCNALIVISGNSSYTSEEFPQNGILSSELVSPSTNLLRK